MTMTQNSTETLYPANPNEGARHPFERAGLGKYPYKFLGSYESKYQAIPGDPSCPVQPGTTCDFCPSPIMQVYRFRSADGKEFKVGCDCMLRAYLPDGKDASFAKDPEFVRAKRAAARLKTAAANARKDERIVAARTALETQAVREALAQHPHPNKWQAAKGKTSLDWAEWTFGNAGRTGKLLAARVVEKMVKG